MEQKRQCRQKEIKNFKCFPDNEIPLNKLTVFAGANGSGKSTAVQALLLLLRHQTEKYEKK
ncbi:MAG: AAA family ATPase [bacterium]|nr:AAA family ATPase [bacterium]